MSDAVSFNTTMPISPPRLTVFDTGSETCPQGQLPGAAVFSVDEAKHALNPLQHLPLIGMLYRQATGETMSAPLSILGSTAMAAAFGGPIGIAGSVALNFVEELARLGPDTSRPPVPEGMDQTGSEAGVRPVSPGSTTQPNGYTTLATTLPDFLGGGTEAQLAAATKIRLAMNTYAGTMVGGG